MELDLYWIRNAGVSIQFPISRSIRAASAMLHVKDMDEFGRMAVVGRGEINFAEIFGYADTAGFEALLRRTRQAGKRRARFDSPEHLYGAQHRLLVATIQTKTEFKSVEKVRKRQEHENKTRSTSGFDRINRWCYSTYRMWWRSQCVIDAIPARRRVSIPMLRWHWCRE